MQAREAEGRGRERAKSIIPKGPKIESIQSRLKFTISLEIFNLAWNVQSNLWLWEANLQETWQEFRGIFSDPQTLRAQRLKQIEISLERLSILTFRIPHKKGGWWAAHLKLSISLENYKKGKGHQNRAPSLLEPRVFFLEFLEPRLEAPRASIRAP